VEDKKLTSEAGNKTVIAKDWEGFQEGRGGERMEMSTGYSWIRGITSNGR
jgi:hypothetical protein